MKECVIGWVICAAVIVGCLPFAHCTTDVSNYPAATVVVKGLTTNAEFVVISTVPSPLYRGSICISEYKKDTGFNVNQVPCHDAIPFPTPGGLR